MMANTTSVISGFISTLAISTPGSNHLVALTGLGGMGKTQLAQHFAISYGPLYPGGIIWLDASNFDPASEDALGPVQHQIRRFSGHLGATIGNAGIRELLETFYTLVAQSGERTLVVIDDLPVGLSHDLVAAWTTPHGRCDVVVTTRADDYESLGASIEVGPLDERSGMRLLLGDGRNAAAPGQVSAARTVVAELGGYPLAIELARAWWSATGDIEALARDIGSRSESVLQAAEQLVGILPSGHEPSILATVLKSVTALSGEGSALLFLAVALPPAPLPLGFIHAWFEHWWNVEQSRGRRRSPTATTGADAGTVAIASLRRLSLAQFSSDGVAIHPIVRQMAPQRMLQRDIENIRAKGVLSLGAYLDMSTSSSDFVSAAAVAPLAAPMARFLGPGDDDLLELWNKLSVVHYYRGDYETAYTAAFFYLSGARRMYGLNDRRTLIAHSAFTKVMALRGQLRNAILDERELADRWLAIASADDPDVIELYASLGAHLMALGKREAAMEYLTKATNSADVSGDNADVGALVAWGNLGEALLQAGESERACAILARVHAGMTASRGPDDVMTVTASTKLALAHATRGELEQALTLDSDAYDRAKRIGGPGSPFAATIAIHLALLQLELSPDAGITTLEGVLDAVVAASGPAATAREVAATLADAHDRVGHADLARRVRETYLGAQDQKLQTDGPESPVNDAAADERTIDQVDNAFDVRGPISRWINESIAAMKANDTGSAMIVLERCIDLTRWFDNDWLYGVAIGELAIATHMNGDKTGALRLLEEEEAVSRRVGNLRGLHINLGNQFQFRAEMGVDAEVRALVAEQLGLSDRVDDPSCRINAVYNSAMLSAFDNDVDAFAGHVAALREMLRSTDDSDFAIEHLIAVLGLAVRLESVDLAGELSDEIDQRSSDLARSTRRRLRKQVRSLFRGGA